MKALVGAFNQEKALVGAFSVIIQPVVEPMDRFTALIWAAHHPTPHQPGFTSHRIEDRKLFMFMRALGQINELFITQYKG